MGLDMYLYNQKNEEVIYWRKANQIFNWFSKKLPEFDNCEEVPVTREMLLELKEDCLKVLNNKSKAASILPTLRGFFFGRTDYDDWYFENLKRTVQRIDSVLENPENESFTYMAWW